MALPGLAATWASFSTPSAAFLRLWAGVDSASSLCTVLTGHLGQKPAEAIPGDSTVTAVPCCAFYYTAVTRHVGLVC